MSIDVTMTGDEQDVLALIFELGRCDRVSIQVPAFDHMRETSEVHTVRFRVDLVPEDAPSTREPGH